MEFLFDDGAVTERCEELGLRDVDTEDILLEEGLVCSERFRSARRRRCVARCLYISG